MRYQIAVFVLIIVVSIAARFFFGLTAMEGLLIWTNLTLGSCAVAALFYQSKAHQHQKAMQKWDANRDTLIRLATTLSDAIESTNQSIREYHEDEDSNGNSIVFKRLHETMRHTIDIHAVLLDDSLKSAINKYKAADDEVRDKWNDDAIEIIDALEESERLMRKLLEEVTASIKSHASL